MDCLTKHISISDDNQRPKLLSVLVNIVILSFATLIWLPVLVLCLPIFLLGLFIWGLPPTIPVYSRILRYFTAVFTEGTPEDNIPFTNRVMIFVFLLNAVVKIPVNGVCWFVDELLYPAYHKVDIKEPVFFITAPRTGSTQLCQYLEEDKENFIVPTVGEGLFPYIWFWKLFLPIFTRFGISQQHIEKLNTFGVEAQKHHEFYFTKAGSWDGLVNAAWHINLFCWCLGSSFFSWGSSNAKLEGPIDEKLHNSFLLFTNDVMKKVMYLRGSPKQRMLLKGHFLLAAEVLKQKYPKAKFFGVVRQVGNH